MDQTDIGLKSVVKALVDTVAPAIDPTDHLAREQLRLAASYVDFVRQRLLLLHSRERYDLRHYLALSQAFLGFGLPEPGRAVAALRAADATARALSDDAAAPTGRIRTAAVDLAHAVAGIVQAAHSEWNAPDLARRIDRAVLDATADKLEMELLWYQPIGFDPSPRKDRTLEDFLG
jgi:hypothetical protein